VPEVAPTTEGGGQGLQKLEDVTGGLRGTLRAQLLDEKFERIEEIQVRELKERLPQASNVKAVVFDGVVTQELADMAAERGVQYVVGMRSRVEAAPANVRVLTLDDLRKSRYRR